MARPKRAARTNRQGKAADQPLVSGAWHDETAEVREGLSLTKPQRRARIYRVFIWVCMALVPPGAFALMASFGTGTQTEKSAAVAPAEVAGEARAAAVTAVAQWLASTPSPVPGGTLVGWDRFDVASQVQDPENRAEDFQIQVHYLTVASSTGALFSVSVPVSYSDLLGARTMASPSLMPVPPAVDMGSDTYPEAVVVSTDEIVESAVAGWTTAYTSGDPLALKQAIGDGSPNRFYMPLTGVTFSEPRILGAWSTSPASPDGATSGSAPKQIVVQVEYDVTWGNQQSDEGNLPLTTLDLLVDGADTAAPRIVAWGGAGSGMGLEPYGNAVEREIVADTAYETDEPAAETAVGPTQRPFVKSSAEKGGE